LLTNRWLLAAIGFSVLVQLAAVEIPLLQRVLNTVPLLWQDWELILACTTAPLIVVEIVKLVSRMATRNQLQNPQARLRQP
jgi:P-type Ca2+ transporter type 2C